MVQVVEQGGTSKSSATHVQHKFKFKLDPKRKLGAVQVNVTASDISQHITR